jgi:hypothetical protein
VPICGKSDRLRAVKTDTIDAGVLASLRATDFLPEIWLQRPSGRVALVAQRNQIIRHVRGVKVRAGGEVTQLRRAGVDPTCWCMVASDKIPLSELSRGKLEALAERLLAENAAQK